MGLIADLNDIECPKCKKKISGLVNNQSGINSYDCWVIGYENSKGKIIYDVDYQQDEFETDGDVNEFVCPECGQIICKNEEEMIALFKKR